MRYREAVCIVASLVVVSHHATRGWQAPQTETPPPSAQGATPPRSTAAEDTVLLRLRALLLASGIPVGVELRPFQAGAPSSEPLPPRVVRQPAINMEVGRPMQTGRAALESFVAANPGYELVADRPVLAVRPIGATRDSSDWLNSAVAAYDVHDVNVVQALAQLRRSFDPAYDASRIRGAIDIDARPFSLTLSQVTVRDVLDAIAVAQGNGMWMVVFSGAKPTFEGARILFATPQNRTHVTAYPGSPPPEPTPGAPGTPGTSSFQPPISLPLTTTAFRNAVVASARQAPAPVGLELGLDCNGGESPDDRLALDVSGLDLAGLASLLLSHCPAYEQRTLNGVLNIGPVGSFEQSPVMNVRTRVFGVAGMPFRDTLQAARAVFDRNLPSSGQLPRTPPPRLDNMSSDRAAAMMADMMKPIDLKLSKPTLRDVLNGLVKAHGAAYWVVDPAPPPMRGPRITFGGSTGWQMGTTFSQGPGPR